MHTPTSLPQTGLFEYSYPTFDDKPQTIYVHFITPDQQQAFVTYPNHRYQKAGQLIPVKWFESVIMVQQDGYSPLMEFLYDMLPRLISPKGPKRVPANFLFEQVDEYEYDQAMLVAA